MPRGRPRKNKDVLIKSAELIGWAIGGLEREISQTRERLAALTAHAARLRARVKTSAGAGTGTIGPVAVPNNPSNGRKKRKKMSPEARKRISEMMKKRWAERRKGK